MFEFHHSPLPAWTDNLTIFGELIARQIYWSQPKMRDWRKRFRSRRTLPQPIVSRAELKDFLREIGVREGALVMAHTAAGQMQFAEDEEGNASKGGFLRVARRLVDDLLELLGPSGTLVMPTNPCYQEEDGIRSAAGEEIVIHYDPRRTACAVGMANELFWRRRGVLRSLYPHNSLAAQGPLAEELLRDNLNRHKPLPHGIHSGYYRLCKRNGLVIGIGAHLRKYLTIVHVPEDVRDADWPVARFFEERRYLIDINGQEEPHTIRQRRPEFGMFCTIRRMFNDLRREGILHENRIGDVIVDWACSGEVFDYIMRRNERSSYPYDGVGWIHWKR
jgi:aminoglycoside 3-N-acetyltransferase